MTKAQETFIKTIGQAAQKYYDTYKILPSLTIAQAILESGWGTTKLATECHNYFGMKWVTGCGCNCKEYSTKEQKSDGTVYTVVAKFRKYASRDTGIKGYYEFLQYKRYANLKGVTDYKKACQLIRENGWATDLNYTTKLINLIETYNLTQYDMPAGASQTIQVAEVAPVQPTYTVGKAYTLQSEMKVRTGAGTGFRAKTYAELTEDGKKRDKDKNGCLDKGTKVTCKEVKNVGNDIWMRTPSGWIAAVYQGKTYIK